MSSLTGRGPTGNTTIKIHLCPTSTKWFWRNIPFPPKGGKGNNCQGNNVLRQPASSWNKHKPGGTQRLSGGSWVWASSQHLNFKILAFQKVLSSKNYSPWESTSGQFVCFTFLKKITSYSNYIHSNYTWVHCPSRNEHRRYKRRASLKRGSASNDQLENPAVSYCSIALCFQQN